MEKSESDFKVHVFVCTNKKNGKPCCADKGGEEIRADLKDWSKQNPEWRKRLRVNASGCLDRCTEGVAVAIYPQNIWLTKVEKSDLGHLKDLIIGLMNESR